MEINFYLSYYNDYGKSAAVSIILNTSMLEKEQKPFEIMKRI